MSVWAEPAAVDRRLSSRRVWALTMALLYPLCALWALAQPMFAGMDEAAHVATAQGFSRFDFSEPFETDGLPMNQQDCFNPSEFITADCADLTWGQAGTEVRTKTDDYPPGFHAVASIPAFVVSGLGGTYVMRLWMAFVCCALVSWAAVLLLRPGRSRWLLLGMLMGLTPMSVSVMSTVNPSGMTVGLTAVAVAGLVARLRWEDRRLSVWVAIGVGLLGLTLVRRDGIAWVLVVFAMFVPVLRADPEWRRRAWLRWREVMGPRARAAIVVLSALLLSGIVTGVLWVLPVLRNFLSRSEVGGNGSRWQGVGEIQLNLQQMVGTLGRVHGFVGYEIYSMVMIGAGVLVALAVAGGRREWSRGTAIGVVALLGTPIAFGFVRFPYFQGRYLLSIWVALMMVAAVAVTTTDAGERLRVRLGGGLLAVWWLVQLFSFWQALRRYSVGRWGGWWEVVSGPAWEPPMMSNGVAVGLLVALVAVPTPFITRQLLHTTR
ncbi:MAG: hypothetical protein RIS41_75 [Actinomycetota bacterium]|jgi:hypothetical protein